MSRLFMQSWAGSGPDGSAPAAGEVFEDAVNLGSDVLKGSRERVGALLAHSVEGPGSALCLLPRCFQLLLPLPLLSLISPPHAPSTLQALAWRCEPPLTLQANIVKEEHKPQCHRYGIVDRLLAESVMRQAASCVTTRLTMPHYKMLLLGINRRAVR